MQCCSWLWVSMWADRLLQVPATKTTGFKWTGSAAITATTSIRAREVPLTGTVESEWGWSSNWWCFLLSLLANREILQSQMSHNHCVRRGCSCTQVGKKCQLSKVKPLWRTGKITFLPPSTSSDIHQPTEHQLVAMFPEHLPWTIQQCFGKAMCRGLHMILHHHHSLLFCKS